MRYCVLSELDRKGFGPGFCTVPEASLGSIVVDFFAIDLSSCGGGLNTGLELSLGRLERGQQISSAAKFAKDASPRAPESSLNFNHKTFCLLENDMFSYEIKHGCRYDMFELRDLFIQPHRGIT